MFKNPFSFKGRIGRLEYGLSVLAYAVVINTFGLILMIVEPNFNLPGFILFYIGLGILLWFIIAQGTKRCHDRGNPGKFQLFPLYWFWMLFADGEIGENRYGPDPKWLGDPGAEAIGKENGL